jgi:hypothetical protein
MMDTEQKTVTDDDCGTPLDTAQGVITAIGLILPIWLIACVLLYAVITGWPK